MHMCTHMYTHICVLNTHVFTSHTYIYTHAYTHAHIHTHRHIHAHTHTHTYTHMHTHSYMHTYTCTHTHSYTRAYTCTRARAHRHTVSQAPVLSTQVRSIECPVHLHDEKCMQGTRKCEHLHEGRQPSTLAAEPKRGSGKLVGLTQEYSKPAFRGHCPTSLFQEASLQHSELLQLQALWEQAHF